MNSVDVGNMEALAGANRTPGLVRDAFLRIDASGGSTITTVGFENLTGSDGLLFDHLAVQVPASGVPEPSTGWLLVSVLLLPAAWKLRH